MFISMAAIGSDGSQFTTGEVHGFVRMLTTKLKQVSAGEGLVMSNILRKLVSTWHHRVDFSYKVTQSGDGFEVLVWTEDEIFFYVDQGTRVRYATMTDDFEPKTTPGSLSGGVGKGGLAYVDVNNPKPGITARRFMETLEKQRDPRYNSRMRTAFDNTVNKWWASIF